MDAFVGSLVFVIDGEADFSRISRLDLIDRFPGGPCPGTDIHDFKRMTRQGDLGHLQFFQGIKPQGDVVVFSGLNQSIFRVIGNQSQILNLRRGSIEFHQALIGGLVDQIPKITRTVGDLKAEGDTSAC